MREIRSHTGLRGIAALLVVLYHYRTRLKGDISPDNWTGLLAGSYVFVDLFFVLSGFIITAVYAREFEDEICRRDWKRYLVNRLARLYPLHFLTTLWMICITVFVLDRPLGPLVPQILSHLLLVQGWGFHEAYALNFPSWSISVEFAAYLLFPLLVLASQTTVLRCALLSVMILGYVALQWTGLGLELHERLPLIRGILGFSLGILVFRWRNLVEAVPRIFLSPLQFGLVLLILGLLHFGQHGTYLMLPMALLVLLIWEDTGILPQILGSKILVTLGQWSYGIYLLHIPVRATFYLVWPHVPLAGTFSDVAFITACVVTTVCLAGFSWTYYECPMRHLLRPLAK